MIGCLCLLAPFEIQNTFGQTATNPKVHEVVSPVTGPVSVGFLRPEGFRVTKDDFVCELVISPSNENDMLQKLTVRRAELEFQRAKLARELAELAVVEYPEGIYKQDQATVYGEMALAEADLRRAEDRLAWSNEMLKRGFVSREQNISDSLTLQKAKFTLEQASTKRVVLEKFTKQKAIKELKSEVEKARSEELALAAKLQSTVARTQSLTRPSKAAQILAPISGRVTYPKSIQASTTFLKGEVLFRVVSEDENDDEK